ncbi:ketopantoate reductase family protein [Azospirillum argentinense]|uniref:2-dehydropantoate 2-reductase n=1 Tax=Azospirillum argentinense TaxID=2970906 RepID=A0A5B0KN85_9PROT|nr:2-dehydropantoate 2-reductase [Azospirillum argentinense]KAA1054137.1 2-dehydropantoate 2-reductase [Azospirillum argentinense]
MTDATAPLRPRIAVLGAGAVGGYIGARLFAEGEDVTLVDGWAEHVAAVARSGLAITGARPEEDETVRVPILPEDRLADLGPVDIAIVAVKSWDTRRAAELLRPQLASGGFVVSAQNGLNEPVIAEVVGGDRVVGLIAARIGVELHRAGRILRRVSRGSPGIPVFRIGEPDGRTTPRIEALRALVAKVDSVTVTGNLTGERWSKLAANAMRNGLSAATGLSIDAMDRDPLLRRFGIRLAGEAVLVGERLGLRLEGIGGTPAALFARAAEGDRAALARVEEALTASAVSGKAAGQRPSMGQDILKGRRTEVEEIYGPVLARAEDTGVDAWANRRVRDAVRRIESGAARPDPAFFQLDPFGATTTEGDD